MLSLAERLSEKKRYEGEQLGLQKGKQLGLAEGEQLGLRKGLQKGLEKGVNPATIAQFTGILIEEIESMAAEREKTGH